MTSAGTDYEFSAAYVEAIIAGLRKHAEYRAFEATLPPELLSLVREPWAQQWQPARRLEALGEAAVPVLGPTAFDEATFVALKQRFGPIVLPMISTAVKQQSPASVLKKLNDLVKVALKGITLEFKPSGERSGALVVAYPRPVAAHVLTSWQGVLRYVFEVTKSGRLVSSAQNSRGNALQYLVEW